MTMFIISAEDVCHLDVVPANTDLSALVGVYGNVITATCHHGYTFLNHSTTEVIECLEFGLWDKLLGDCLRT